MNQKYYTVWSRKTDEVLACGTSEECAKMLGMSSSASFRCMVSRSAKGRNKRYVVLKENGSCLKEE